MAAQAVPAGVWKQGLRPAPSPVALEATSQVSQVFLDLLPLTLFGGGPAGLHPVAAAGSPLNSLVQGAGGLGHCDAPEPSSSGNCLLPSAKC